VRSSLAGLAALALGLGACAVNESEDIAAYRSVLDAGLSSPVVAPAKGARLDVRGSMRLANARYEVLDIEGEAYVRALLDRKRAAAAFLPKFSFSPELFRDESTVQADRKSGLDAPVSGGIVTNPVMDEAEIRRTDLTADERRSRLLALQDAVLLDVGRAHLLVVLVERRVEVLRSSLAVQEARADDARQRRDAGLARPLDAALAESRAASTLLDLVDAETSAVRGRALLEFLTGTPLDGVVLDGTLDAPATPPPIDPALAAASERREEVLAARWAVKAALAGVESAYGGWYPRITADVTAFLEHDSNKDAPDWTSLLRVSVPLFTAGVVEADVRTALSELREARDRLSLARRAVQRDVLESWTAFDAARRRIEAVLVRLDAAQRAVDQADGLWSAGLATNLERLVAQEEQLTAELDLASAEIGRKAAWLDFSRAQGALHEIVGLDRSASVRLRDVEEPRAQAR
jgi:outer membrane protein TolC